MGTPLPRDNGRTLTDEASDAFLAILTNRKVAEDKVGPHRDLLAEFPYLGSPPSGGFLRKRRNARAFCLSVSAFTRLVIGVLVMGALGFFSEVSLQDSSAPGNNNDDDASGRRFCRCARIGI